MFLSVVKKIVKRANKSGACSIAILFLLTSFSVSAKEFSTIEWVDLIPPADLEILSNPPKSVTDIPHGQNLSDFPSDDELDQLSNSIANAINDATNTTNIDQVTPSPEEQAYSAALQSTNVNTEFHQKNIRLPGFVVPVEYNDDQVITEFFLVPYFGACIHVPPPPPNQIIYVKYPQGLELTALYDPFWIEGTMQTELIQNDIALSAYSINAVTIKPYEEYQK
jgi:hypothetical protein